MKCVFDLDWNSSKLPTNHVHGVEWFLFPNFRIVYVDTDLQKMPVSTFCSTSLYIFTLNEAFSSHKFWPFQLSAVTCRLWIYWIIHSKWYEVVCVRVLKITTKMKTSKDRIKSGLLRPHFFFLLHTLAHISGYSLFTSVSHWIREHKAHWICHLYVMNCRGQNVVECAEGIGKYCCPCDGRYLFSRYLSLFLLAFISFNEYNRFNW